MPHHPLRSTGGRRLARIRKAAQHQTVPTPEASLPGQESAMRMMVHDLRNPLNSLLLMAQLLAEMGGTPEMERIASRILRQCEEMTKIIARSCENLPG